MKIILISSFILGLLYATPPLNKTFYRVIEEKGNPISIDTLTTFQIIDSEIVVDKISMDWYVFKIDRLTATDFSIEFDVSQECNYLNFEANNIKWRDLTILWYKKNQLIKDKKSFIWKFFHSNEKYYDLLVDSLDFPKLKLPIYKYEE